MLSWSQLKKWIRFYNYEPFGDLRDDIRAGVIAAEIGNANRDLRKYPALKPTDFILFRPDLKDLTSISTRKKPIQWDELEGNLLAFAKARSRR